MNKLALLLPLAAFSSGMLSAQVNDILVTSGPNWAIVPNCQTLVVPFGNVSATGNLFGSCTAQIGTTASGCLTVANASFQGTNTGGAQVVGGSQVFVTGTENYFRNPTGGRADMNITVQPSGGSIFRQGNGYRAAANASVTVQWPGGGPITATVQVTGLPQSGYPILATVPVTLVTSTTNLSTWFLTMTSQASTSGSVGNGTLQMLAACQAVGTVNLL